MKRTVIAVLLLAACDYKPVREVPAGPAPLPPQTMAEKRAALALENLARESGLTVDQLLSRYQKLSEHCLREVPEIMEFHRKLGRKTYDYKGALAAIPGLCDAANARP